MNALVTREQREIYERVAAISDPEAECRRRFPDFHFVERQETKPASPGEPERPRAYHVAAFWTSEGAQRGLEHVAGRPTATPEQVAEAKRLISFQALVNHEHRKRKALAP